VFLYSQVSRAGKREKVLIFDLLVGDVVHLNIGDQVPGDGLFIAGHQLTIDESSMTGESQPVSQLVC
jgi:Ca2+-transporting ATPase